MTVTALFACIVLVAALIQGTAGFGFMFFALPLSALLLDFKTAVVTLGITAQALNLAILVQHRFRADWKTVAVLALCALPGIPLGVWALSSLPVHWLQGFLGATLMTFVLYQRLARPEPRGLGLGWTAFTGLAAGALGGAMHTQGPPVLVYVSLQPWPKDRTKATLVGFFFITGLFILPYQASKGLVTADVLSLTAWCLPLMLLGVAAGRRVYLRLGERTYKDLFMALIFALGVLLASKALFAG